MDLEMCIYDELNYTQVKFGVNPSISFDVIRSGWSILSRSGKGSSWLALQFEVLGDNIDLTPWCWVQPSRHKRDDKTDTKTHTHTDRQTEWLGQKHNTLFQRFNKWIDNYVRVRYDDRFYLRDAMYTKYECWIWVLQSLCTRLPYRLQPGQGTRELVWWELLTYLPSCTTLRHCKSALTYRMSTRSVFRQW